jgi:hypothetical protein
MGAQITKVGYKRAGYPSGAELPFLIGNTGESYLATIEFEVAFSFVSSFNRPVFWKDSAFEMLGGTWAEEGFNVGDVVNFQFYDDAGAPIASPSGGATTVQFIDGNRLVVADGTAAALNTNSLLANDVMYPNGQDTGSCNINVSKNPQGIGIRFNLIDNEQPGSIFSLYGGLAPYYRWLNVASMTVGQTVQMDFLGWRSGGNIERVNLTRIAITDPFGLKRKFRLQVEFNTWGWFENGNEGSQPSFFELNKCLKPYFEIDIFPQNANPNTGIKLKNNALQANTGWFDQNNNVDGLPNYSVKNIQFTILGNPVTGIDYSTTTHVRVTFRALAQNQLTSFFSYGMLYVPRDASVYQEKYGWLGEHLLLSNGGWNKIYQNQFSPDPAIQGYTNPDTGAQLATANVYFQVNAPADEVYLDFDVIPNSAATTYFADREDGDREVIIYASIGNSFQISQPLEDDRVSVLAYRGQLEKQPIIAGPYDKVDFTGFYQHPNVDGDILNPVAVDTFKEDDVMYRVDFRLVKGANVQSLTAQIDKNGLNPLERFIINTEGLPVLNDGTIHIDYQNFRNYKVPQDIQSRRKVVLKRNPSLDTLTDAGYTLEYGFLSRWEYWIANQNVPLTYFNPALPNNGLNNDWILFEPLNVRLLIEIDGLSYFVEGDLSINNYDSSADVTSIHELFLLDGVTPVGALLAGEELIVRATHTKTTPWDPTSVWGWIKAENRESNAYARISSVWDWNTMDKPFRPLTGETKCKLSFPTATQAVLETVVVVDEIINTGLADFTSRIEGERANPVNSKLLESGEYKVTDGPFPFGNKKKILD